MWLASVTWLNVLRTHEASPSKHHIQWEFGLQEPCKDMWVINSGSFVGNSKAQGQMYIPISCKATHLSILAYCTGLSIFDC